MALDPTDISLEPLFNQSAEGAGSSKKIAFVPINTAAVATHRTPIEVSSTAAQLTITAGHRTFEIQNASSTEIIYYGGSGVTSSNGIKLFPNQTKIFANVQDTFSIYVVADGAETPEARIVEYT